MTFWCLGDEDTVRGFRLAGVAGTVVTRPEETAAALERAAAEPDCGVILLTEAAAAGIRAQLLAIRARRRPPLVVEIPGPDGPLPGHRTLRQLAQEAVGIHLE